MRASKLIAVEEASESSSIQRFKRLESSVVIIVIFIFQILSFECYICSKCNGWLTKQLDLEHENSSRRRFEEQYAIITTDVKKRVSKIEVSLAQNKERRAKEAKSKVLKLVLKNKSQLQPKKISSEELQTPPDLFLMHQEKAQNDDENCSYSFQRGLQAFERPSENASLCDQTPILSSVNHINNFTYDERLDRILNIFHGFLSLDVLNNPFTSEYKAACWILFDDELNISPDDELLVSRFVVATLLFSVENATKIHLPDNACDHISIKCNEDGFISSLDMSKYLIYCQHEFQRFGFILILLCLQFH